MLARREGRQKIQEGLIGGHEFARVAIASAQVEALAERIARADAIDVLILPTKAGAVGSAERRGEVYRIADGNDVVPVDAQIIGGDGQFSGWLECDADAVLLGNIELAAVRQYALVLVELAHPDPARIHGADGQARRQLSDPAEP